ncbi:MAG: DinB family protein [Nocardioides sp.]|nr:DinB family protein [Nocardioides sp.]
MSDIFPSPTLPVSSRAGVFLGYLDYFRSRVIAKVEALDAVEQRRSRLPSGWAPLEVIKHLMFVELRWLEWGFEGRSVDDLWGDQRDGHWYVSPDETAADLIAALIAQSVRSEAIIKGNDLTTVDRPGPRWEDAEPATLERILFHLVQEYARHLGHLDIVVEIANGQVGE